jgi:CrcB protein
MKFLMVFLGGGAGSVTRYALSLMVGGLGLRLPLATLLSNALASVSLVAAVVWLQKTNLAQSLYPYLLVIGFCGGLSTFSTFSWETFALWRSGHVTMAALNVLLNLLLAMGAVFWLMRLWSSGV